MLKKRKKLHYVILLIGLKTENLSGFYKAFPGILLERYLFLAIFPLVWPVAPVASSETIKIPEHRIFVYIGTVPKNTVHPDFVHVVLM